MSKRVELLEVIDARISSVGAICRCDLCSDSQSNSHMTLMAIAKLPNSVLNVITCRHVPIFYHIHFQVFTPVFRHQILHGSLYPSIQKVSEDYDHLYTRLETRLRSSVRLAFDLQ